MLRKGPRDTQSSELGDRNRPLLSALSRHGVSLCVAHMNMQAQVCCWKAALGSKRRTLQQAHGALKRHLIATPALAQHHEGRSPLGVDMNDWYSSITDSTETLIYQNRLIKLPIYF